MKAVQVIFLITILLLTSCENDEESNREVSPIIGTWIRVEEFQIRINYTGEIDTTSVPYDPNNDNFLRASITEFTPDGDHYSNYLMQVSPKAVHEIEHLKYRTTGNILTYLEEDNYYWSCEFEFRGDTLVIINDNLDDYESPSLYREKHVRYNGPIPPKSWK